MDQNLQTVIDIINNNNHLSEEEKAKIIASLKDADKTITITEFKLDRTEKVKRTTAILLEETIQELEQKRKAVEAQNRELEIESFLERVRSIALSMKEPADMLEVCSIIAIELDKLGVKEIRNVQTAIFYESKGTYMNYEYYARHDKTIITETSYTNHKMHQAFAAQMLKGKGEFFSTHMSKAELPGWIAYQKTTNVFIDTYLEKASSLNYYWYSLGPVALGISTYIPLNEDEINLFKRFLKVFELAYRRFLDIEKAIAQAKEAQIELALERVRARTMAMQKSDELTETSFVLFQQFKDLGETSEQISIGVFNEDENIMELYSTLYGSQWKEVARVDLDEPVVMKKIHAAWKEQTRLPDGQEKSLVIDLAGNDLRKYNAFRKKLSNLEYREDRWVIHIAFFSKGVLTFSTTEPRPHETIQLLERFAGVFDGTYTRFLDLQKAEAQARESQIQLALERVRARTMAMQHSEELRDAASLLFKQIADLGTRQWSSGFDIWNANEVSAVAWMSNPDGSMGVPFTVPYTEDPFFKQIYEARQSGEDFFVMESSGKELEETYEYLFNLPQAKKHFDRIESLGFQMPKSQITHCAFFSQGYLMFITFEAAPEMWDIFKRFAKVFEQTYTRFLDLQKAEAQAREAKIEAALEKVRSRTMAMQKSDELGDVATILFKELNQLVENLWTCGFVLCERGRTEDEWWLSGENGFIPDLYLPHIGDSTHENMYNAWSKGESYYAEVVEGEALKQHYEWLMTIPSAKRAFEDMAAAGEAKPTWQKLHCAYFSQGYLVIITQVPCQEEQVFKRFAQVFDQTYTRFLDLQKAEAQAREARIEAALEKVRSRSLAMQKSEELKEVIQVVYEQFVHLKILVEHAGFIMDYKERDDMHIWLADQHEVPSEVFIPYFDSAHWNSFNEAKEKGTDFFANLLDFEEKNKFYQDLFALIPGVPEETLEYYFSCPGLAGSTVLLENVCLYIENFKGIPYTEEENATLMRFGKVFQQTYTRFLDLQKAEAQSRESQIELGLERVRARAMAMQKSDELAELVDTVFKELTKLDFALSWCMINIIDEPSMSNTVWGANPEIGKAPESYHMLFEDYRFHHEMMQEWKERNTKWVFVLKGTEKEIYDEYLFNQTEFRRVPEPVQKVMRATKQYAASFTFSNFGGLQTVGEEPLSEENLDILGRFGKVFDLTYTRFNDLQKAEAQAREAKIEAALERIRSSAMAMHSSEGILEVTHVLREQIALLGEKELESILVHIYHEDTDQFEAWYSYRHPEYSDGQIVNGKQTLNWSKTARARKDKEKYYEKETDYTIVADHKMLKEWYEYLFKLVPEVVELNDKGEILVPGVLYYNYSKISGGALLLITNNEASDHSKHLLMRAARVFNLAYSRFLDLQKAEAQAREARIEAALERVRSKAMAMQKSEDLANAVAIVFEELDKLNLGMLRCGIGIINKGNRSVNVWASAKSDKDMAAQISGDESMDIHPLLQGAFNAWLKQEEYSYILQGKDLTDYYEKQVSANFKLPDSHSLVTENQDVRQYYFLATFQAGGLFAFRETAFSEEAKIVMKRFADVFNLTYTRYNDLQLAEAQTREAKIETALERVRSRTLAMQKSDELAETAAVVFKQLIGLGIAPNRLYIGIIKDESGNIEFWVTDEDGTKVSTQFTGNVNMNPSMQKMFDGWKAQKKSLTMDMHDKELSTYFHYLSDELHVPFKQGLSQKRRIQTIAYFSKGFIGIASPDEQPASTTFLLERFAGVFNLTFTRFNDLKVAEAHAEQAEQDLIKLQTEKKRAEDALTELRATQTQLIQSEKMASLGELTAGIAHEIQNPLNFVNNFSEVSNELIDEMNEEIEKGNNEEAKAIAHDIKQNLEKINHHGKRADAIVKGMLQHSRSSTGQKEPTDINVLADEYLRLTFHGMRAKDKSFNANFKTDFDNSIGKINIIPQDIGRVILNLLTNAFYAVQQKQKEIASPYEPTVLVSTKKSGDQVFLTVSDNGNGIPQKVLDKIFQPFFTTKPTGQGTGLGLSLSYDIIKAHGGEIKVETKEAEGTTFIIQLPKLS